jgi:hypothetical protein
VATPPAPPPNHVAVSAESLEEVLEAIKRVADAIATNTAVITGSGGGNGDGGGRTDPTVRTPTNTQSRSIVDYLVVSQLLSRIGFAGRVVQARREADGVVRLRNVPTDIDGIPVLITQARVTPRFGAGETAQLQDSSDPDPGLKFFELETIADDVEIVRIELQNNAGVPLALGPRLAPILSGIGGGGGVDVRVGSTTSGGN